MFLCMHACGAQSAVKRRGVPIPANLHHLASNTTTGGVREEMEQAHTYVTLQLEEITLLFAASLNKQLVMQICHH